MTVISPWNSCDHENDHDAHADNDDSDDHDYRKHFCLVLGANTIGTHQIYSGLPTKDVKKLADVYRVAGFGPFTQDAIMLQAVYNTAIKLGALQLSPKTIIQTDTWTTSDLTSCYLVPTVTLVSLWASTAPNYMIYQVFVAETAYWTL